jgi:hypothetical protein
MYLLQNSMKLSPIENFHFVYTLIGPPYINALVKMLQTAPKEANVVIITNTPQLLDNVSVPCKLIVVDLEILRTDEDRINEPILCITDEDEYFKEIGKIWRSFPIGIIRHGVKWCAENDITNFILCDIGCYITDIGMYTAFEEFKKHFKAPECSENIIMGHPNRLSNGRPHNEFVKRIKGENSAVPGIENLMHSMGFDTSKQAPNFKFIFLDGNLNPEVRTYDGDLDLDGFLIGYLFQDKNLLLKYYNFWNELVRLHYRTKLSARMHDGIVGHEFTSSFTSEMFARFHDVTLIAYRGIVWHERRPDNDPSVAYSKFINGWFIQTQTRKEFIEAQREYLIWWYGPNKIQVYGLENDFNYKAEEWPFIKEMYENLHRIWEHPVILDRKEIVKLNREFYIYYYGPEKIKKYNLEDMLSFDENEWLTIKNKFDEILKPYVYVRDYERNGVIPIN